MSIFFVMAAISAHIYGQLGNNLFQVATAHAVAWDQGVEATFPNLTNYEHVFFRCKREVKPVEFIWQEPSYAFNPIPLHPHMHLIGYFQSEKYFKHHREKLLSLFAPHPNDEEYMHKKYEWLINAPHTVGIQLRYYRHECPAGSMYPQYGREYFEKAMNYFPQNSLFIVSTNNLEFAKREIPIKNREVIFLEGEENYIDLYLLHYCKDLIISNSSFGWWAAWLNQNPDKVIIAPEIWVEGLPAQDVCPEEWVRISSGYN